MQIFNYLVNKDISLQYFFVDSCKKKFSVGTFTRDGWVTPNLHNFWPKTCY